AQKDRAPEVRAAVADALRHLGLSPTGEMKLLRVALKDGVRCPQRGGVACRKCLEDWDRRCVIRALKAMGPAAAPALDALQAKAGAGRERGEPARIVARRSSRRRYTERL